MLIDPNNLANDLRLKLEQFRWSPNNYLDLHKLGVHYYTPAYLPTRIDPLTYSTLLHRGLTPPVSLPIHVGDDMRERIDKFLDFNYYKLVDGGVQYLGNEYNVQRREDWDKAKVRVCLCRLSDYHTLDGAFGGFLIGNFINDYAPSEDVFVDFSFFPALADIGRMTEAGLPYMFGNISHQPLTEFDIVIIATSYPGERVNLPAAIVKSGLPLYRWERFAKDLPYKTPILALAGIGASFIENVLGDNPIHGPAGNALADHVLIGEGEMMDLKYIQQYLNVVKYDGGSKEDFMKSIDNEHNLGVYDPSLVLFEYADKVHTERDFTGKVVRTRTFEAGGHIKNIHMLDHDGHIRYSMAGRDSEEFKDMEAINAQYHLRMAAGQDPAALGRKYIKVSDRPNIQARKEAGLTPGLTPDKMADAAYLGTGKVSKPSSG